MKQITKRFATGLAWSLIALFGSTFAAVPEASAHGVTELRHVDYNYYPYRQSTYIFPRWLRAKQDFQRWYYYSHYRYMRRLSWQRLYDLYLYDNRYTRRAWRNDHRHYDRDWHKHERRDSDRDRRRNRRG